MRKAATVIGLGAFFLTMALLLRFYAYDKLAVVPLDQNTQQVVQDRNATFFDADKIAPGKGTLTTKVTVVADKAASEKASDETGKDVLVFNQWRSSDNNNEAPPMDASTGRVAIDRSTGEALDCCDTKVNGKDQQYSGYLIKFPFQTQKKQYDYWDGTVNKAVPMKYVGEEKVDGLNTYKFEGSVPLQKFRTQDVPRKIFGLSDQSVLADRLYENKRTIWVEPETGVFMKVQENQHQILRIDAPGAKDVNALTTKSVMTPKTVQENVDEYGTKATLLKILRLWAPLALALLGLVLLIGGIAMSLRARRRQNGDDGDADRDGYDGPDGDDDRHANLAGAGAAAGGGAAAGAAAGAGAGRGTRGRRGADREDATEVRDEGATQVGDEHAPGGRDGLGARYDDGVTSHGEPLGEGESARFRADGGSLRRTDGRRGKG